MQSELEKAYQPKSVESKTYQMWERSGFFNPDKLPGVRKNAFSIAMPPPNVTGELHLGHATALTIEDLLTRYHRMAGDKTLYLPGTDHAGISTQVMVERLIATQGLSKHKIGRDQFLKRVWSWKKKYGSRITEQVRQLGTSCDWSRERFTMDEELTKTVQHAFITMFNDGLIYRGNRIVNWCPRCASALSDLEVKHQEASSKLWFIRYPLFGSTKYLVVATTRPETMLGDSAVAVNPSDKRYKNYVGKSVILPLTNREIPIITDERVDPAFGTGAVKVTPAHDHLDYEIGEDHSLPIINVIGQNGQLTKDAGEFYGKSVQQARHEIVQRLEEDELLEKTVEYVHNLARCERCSAPIEPLISKQWFIRAKPLAKPAIAAVKKGKVKITPQRFEKVYYHWMNNIKDWCISRQLWWGHQIPIWYCGTQYDLPEKRMGFHKNVVPQLLKNKIKTYRLRDHKLRTGDSVAFENSQTGEVFGTSIIQKVEQTTVGEIQLNDKDHHDTYKNREKLIAAFKRHHPKRKITNTTPVSIYTYTFSPLDEDMKGCGAIIPSADKPKHCPKCKHSKHLIQDPDTLDTWFSSSLWTFSTLGWPNKTKDLKTFHPTSVMETGWDILFFWVARMIMMSLYFTKEVPFKNVYLHGLVLDRHGKKMSKSKGTGVDPLLMTEKYGTDAIRMSLTLGTAPGQDFRLYEEKIAGYRNFINKLWNVSRYILANNQTVDKKLTNLSLADRWILSEFQILTKRVTDEIKKFNFSDAGTALYDFLWHEFADWYLEVSKASRNDGVLQHILENFLKLAHPFMPFVSEEIWQRWQGNSKSKLLMIQAWPSVDKKLLDKESKKQFGLIKQFVTGIRNFRSEHKIAASEKVTVYYWGKNIKLVAENSESIKLLACVGTLENKKHSKPTGTFSGLDYFIEHKQSGEVRQKDIENISKYIQKIEQKLSNKKFIANAPKEIIEQEKQKLDEQRDRLKKLL